MKKYVRPSCKNIYLFPDHALAQIGVHTSKEYDGPMWSRRAEMNGDTEKETRPFQFDWQE